MYITRVAPSPLYSIPERQGIEVADVYCIPFAAICGTQAKTVEWYSHPCLRITSEQRVAIVWEVQGTVLSQAVEIPRESYRHVLSARPPSWVTESLPVTRGVERRAPNLGCTLCMDTAGVAPKDKTIDKCTVEN